jgi:hypothetical protein
MATSVTVTSITSNAVKRAPDLFAFGRFTVFMFVFFIIFLSIYYIIFNAKKQGAFD